MNQIQNELEMQATQWLGASGLKIEAVTKLSEFSHIVAQFFRGEDNNQKWLFRGEGSLYDFPLTPSIFRIDPKNIIEPFTRNDYPKKSITDQEIVEVRSCQSDHPDGSDRYIKAFMPSMHLMDVNWLPLARHFGYKTRLLDVTVNPLVALFFACQPHSCENAYVYAMQSGSFRPVNAKNPPTPDIREFPHIPISYLDLYDVDVELHGDKYDKLPYLFEASIPQERLQAQGGRFLFWRYIELQLPKATQIIPIRISAEAKENLLSELSAFGVIKTVLFPND